MIGLCGGEGDAGGEAFEVAEREVLRAAEPLMGEQQGLREWEEVKKRTCLGNLEAYLRRLVRGWLSKEWSDRDRAADGLRFPL